MGMVRVSLGDKSYDVEIGNGNLLKTDFRRFTRGRCAILTDSNVRELYAERLKQYLIGSGLDAEWFEFFPRQKTPENAIALGMELARNNFDKDSLLIAVGGGVPGDLTGFVASFYLRGVDYIQVPTTLLAQVDSSIGGKTGVDIPEGKNLFGHIHQPKAVITDIETLKTLSSDERKNGLAEIIKYGMTQDFELFKDVEENFSARDDEFYLRIIERSCRIKASIVERDEKEEELRKILNYGHTIGHAIETAEGNMPHGEAIGLGMAYEGMVSVKLGLLDYFSLRRQNELITKIGLPTRYRGNLENLVEIMRRDKKSRDGKLYFVLPVSIGTVKEEKGKVAFPVDETLVRKCLRS